MKSRHLLALAASAVVLCAGFASTVGAQVVVFDPKSYLQSVLTAARQLQ
jgi:conjugal transfer/entry exclusion protein